MQGEGRSDTLRTPQRHASSVICHDMLDDGQTEAGAAGHPAAGRIDSIEPLEDALLLGLRNADTLIGNGDFSDLRGLRCSAGFLSRALAAPLAHVNADG